MKLKIIKVEDEESLDGCVFHEMTLQAKRGTYIRSVAASAWEDERSRRSVERSWLKDIGEIEEAKEKLGAKMKAESKTEDEVKAERKAEMKATRADIKGTEIEEDE